MKKNINNIYKDVYDDYIIIMFEDAFSKYYDITKNELKKIVSDIEVYDKEKKNIFECSYCQSLELIIDSIKNIVVCNNCGLINKELLDESFDFNSENVDNNNSRYGTQTSFFYPQASLSTKIKSKRNRLIKLSYVQKQGQTPYKERSLMDVFDKMQTHCKLNGISQTIIDTAKIFYKNISEATHTKGKRIGKTIIMRCVNRKSIIAACLFHACKCEKEPRSPKEIAIVYDLDVKHVNRGCRKFCDIIDTFILFNQIKNSYSTEFIQRYSKQLFIPDEYISKIKQITNNIYKLNIVSTHEPPSIAAGCIMLIINNYELKIAKKKISEIFGISDVTICKTFRKISPYFKILENDKLTDIVLDKVNNIKEKLYNNN